MARNEQLEANTVFVNTAIQENSKLKKEAEAAKKANTKAVKEAKAIREELRTCQLNRDYHKEAIEIKTALASDL